MAPEGRLTKGKGLRSKTIFGWEFFSVENVGFL